MGIAGARELSARLAARLRPSGHVSRRGSALRALARELADAVRSRPAVPGDVRGLCRALCEEMSARRGGRPVELRFERFPDELEVTGLCVEFADFDLVIVEERAAPVQQLVILGHELWHLHAGHRHHRLAGDAAARAFAEAPGRLADALTVAARNGSRAADEAEADDFGHRLATLFRGRLSGDRLSVTRPAPPDPLQRALGYRGREQASEPKGRAGVERANARRREAPSTIGISTPASSAPEVNRASEEGGTAR